MVRDRSSVAREEASRLEHLSEMEFVSRSVALRRSGLPPDLWRFSLPQRLHTSVPVIAPWVCNSAHSSMKQDETGSIAGGPQGRSATNGIGVVMDRRRWRRAWSRTVCFRCEQEFPTRERRVPSRTVPTRRRGVCVRRDHQKGCAASARSRQSHGLSILQRLTVTGIAQIPCNSGHS